MKNLTAVTSSPFDTVGVYGVRHGFPNRGNEILEPPLLSDV